MSKFELRDKCEQKAKEKNIPHTHIKQENMCASSERTQETDIERLARAIRSLPMYSFAGSDYIYIRKDDAISLLTIAMAEPDQRRRPNG